MKNAIVIHGAFGHPEENWLPWLKSELQNQGYIVTIPEFPTPEGQNYHNWMEVITPHLTSLTSETILIGHSIGATFALSILEKLEQPVAKTILASGFVGPFEGEYADETFDAINKTIAERDFDWEKIKENAGLVHIFHGANDPYVPPEKPQFLGKQLHVKPVIIPDGGHLNEAAGFVRFPQLLDVIG